MTTQGRKNLNGIQATKPGLIDRMLVSLQYVIVMGLAAGARLDAEAYAKQDGYIAESSRSGSNAYKDQVA